jgi:hypothetical protein
MPGGMKWLRHEMRRWRMMNVMRGSIDEKDVKIPCNPVGGLI